MQPSHPDLAVAQDAPDRSSTARKVLLSVLGAAFLVLGLSLLDAVPVIALLLGILGLLVIGLGLDYALFFNRPEDQGEERRRTVFGLLVCSATTILVFGVLAFSKIPVLHAIGLTAACGSLWCLIFAGFLAEQDSHVA